MKKTSLDGWILKLTLLISLVLSCSGFLGYEFCHSPFKHVDSAAPLCRCFSE